jgi:hypothetical protein
VASLINSRAAMSQLDDPRATRASTSSSRLLSRSRAGARTWYSSRGVRYYPAVVDHGHLVAESLGLFHEMGDQQDRHPGGPDLRDEVPDFSPGVRVQAGGQFVERIGSGYQVFHCLLATKFLLICDADRLA